MTRITIDELHHIEKLYKEQHTQKNIKAIIDLQRHELGTYKGKGISTNTVSQLSPGSKHRDSRTSSIHDYWDKASVILKIMSCMSCSKKEANTIFKNRIMPLCLSRFHDPANMSNLISIRYYALACNSRLYYIFTTEDYAETMGLDPELHADDVWTVKTDHEYSEILDGSLDFGDIMEELVMEAQYEYSPQLINVCIRKA